MALRRGLLLLPLLLAACDDPRPRGEQASPQPRPAAAREAAALRGAEDRLRARLRAEGPLALRAVQVHRQALADTLAVCGQVNPSGRADDAFTPWVAVVGFEGDTPARVEFHLAASSPEATRVYFEMVDRCFDGGGPATARSGPRPLPPAPAGLPRAPAETPVAAGAAPPAAQAAPAMPPPAPTLAAPAMPTSATPAQGRVTTTQRHPVNIRANPSGGGEVLRIVPRGSALQVFGEAPGGWLQVGEDEPWGWLHSSLLEGR